MRKSAFLLSRIAAAAVAATAAFSANADTFHFEFDGLTALVGAAAVDADLFITTSGNALSFESVTGISGTIFTNTPEGNYNITGLDFSGFAGADQKFQASDPYVTFDGISFVTSYTLPLGQIRWNLFSTSGSPTEWVLRNEYDGPCCGGGIPTYGFKSLGDLHMAAVPEPETYAMMLAGLGALGFMARRRRQQS